jgi:hypothetical protein
MNDVSAVYFVVIVVMMVDWLVREKRQYRGQTTRLEEAEVVMVRTGSVSVQEARRRSSIVNPSQAPEVRS